MKKKFLILPSIFLVIIVVLTLNLQNPIITKVDKSVSNFILINQNQSIINFSEIIGTLFDTLPMILISLLISLILFIKSKTKEGLYFASSSIIAGGLIYILKELISRPRPVIQAVQETSFSFPSGHATISAIFFGFMILFSVKYLQNKTQKVIAITTSILFILTVGFTRIYLNVHWLTDIIGGYLLGAIIVLISIFLYKNN